MKVLAMLQALDIHRLRGTPKGICTDRIIGTRKGIGVLSKNIANEENKLLNQC